MLGITIATLLATAMMNNTTADVNTMNVYAQTMAVVDINEAEDTAILADFNGYEYEIEEVEDLMIGDVCSVVMCDNGTTNITDDMIIDVKYSGWVDCWGYDIDSKLPLYYFEEY